MAFKDRRDAGRRLGDELAERGVEADIVLAIPRGGLPLGREVADALGAPLDVAVAQKMGAPGNSEYAIGAVAADGSVWRNETAIRELGVDDEYIENARREEAENAREKADRYRENGPPDLAGKSVVVVDDGVATGATARACVEQVRSQDPERIVLAVPVGSPRTIEELRASVDELVCLETPSGFRAVGGYYENFDQVTDEEAMDYLDRS